VYPPWKPHPRISLGHIPQKGEKGEKEGREGKEEEGKEEQTLMLSSLHFFHLSILIMSTLFAYQ
jgi:hypothetical protein